MSRFMMMYEDIVEEAKHHKQSKEEKKIQHLMADVADIVGITTEDVEALEPIEEDVVTTLLDLRDAIEVATHFREILHGHWPHIKVRVPHAKEKIMKIVADSKKQREGWLENLKKLIEVIQQEVPEIKEELELQPSEVIEEGRKKKKNRVKMGMGSAGYGGGILMGWHNHNDHQHDPVTVDQDEAGMDAGDTTGDMGGGDGGGMMSEGIHQLFMPKNQRSELLKMPSGDEFIIINPMDKASLPVIDSEDTRSPSTECQALIAAKRSAVHPESIILVRGHFVYTGSNKPVMVDDNTGKFYPLDDVIAWMKK